MNIATVAALASSLTDQKMVESGRVGKAERKVYTYDGKGETVEMGGTEYASLVEEYIDPYTITKITGYLGDTIVEVGPEKMTIHQESMTGMGLYIVNVDYNGEKIPVIMILQTNVGDTSKGATYVLHNTLGYVSQVEVHIVQGIHPQYLPTGGFGYTEPGRKMFSATLEGGIFESEGCGRILEAGKTYTVQVDSGIYTTVCVEIGGGARCIGNVSIALPGTPDSGERFLIFNDDSGFLAILDGDLGKQCTISVNDMHHTIDPKYLPEGGVGYMGTKPEVIVFDTETQTWDLFPNNDHSSVKFVRIHDIAVAPEKVNILYPSTGVVTTINRDGLSTEYFGVRTEYSHDGIVLVIAVPYEFTVSGLAIKAGTYVRHEGLSNPYVSSVEYATEVPKTIDPKYIPENIPAVEKLFANGQVGRQIPSKEIFSCDLQNGMFSEDIASFPEIAAGGKYIVSMDSGNYETVCHMMYEEQTGADKQENGFVLGNLALLHPGFDDTSEKFVVLFAKGMSGTTNTGVYSAAVLDRTGGDNPGKHCSVFTTETINSIAPKFLPSGGFGYTEITHTPDILYWDGDVNEKESIRFQGVTLYRISETPITADEIRGVTLTGSDGSTKFYDETGSVKLNIVQGNIVGAGPLCTAALVGDTGVEVAVVPMDVCVDDNIVAKRGIYARHDESGFVSAIHGILKQAETVHHIDPKYLPGTVVLDLTKFKCVYNGEVAETTLNEVVRSLVSRSINGGGTLVTASVTDIDDVFAAVGSNRDIIIRTDLLEGVETEGRPTVVRLNSFPVQLASVYPIVISNTMLDVSVCFVRSQLGVDMYASAKPII